MTSPLRLLLVEDSLLDAKLIIHGLNSANLRFTCTRVDTSEDLAEQLRTTDWDLVISDYSLPQMNGLYVVRTVAATGKDIPVIMVSGTIGEDTAVAAMQAGADDYLMKDNLTRLVPAIERAIRQAANRREKRQAEQEMQRAKGQLEAFFHSSLQANYLLSVQGNIQRLNRIAREYGAKIFGREPRVGDNFFEYLDPEHFTAFAESFQRCLRGEALLMEESIAVAGVGVLWYQTKYYPVFDGQGTIQGVAYSTFDITQRKQAEVDMEELRIRLEGIITSALDAIITTDNDYRIVLMNEAAEKMFGYSAGELFGQSIDQLIPQRLRDFQSAQAGHSARQLGINTTLCGLRADGTEFPVEASLSQAEVAGKKYFTVILRDITLRVEAQRQEQKLNHELIRQNEQLQQFAYITSHNLRGPVATLLGLVDLINRQDGLSSENAHIVDNMDKTVQKLDTIIKDLNTILEYKKGLNAVKEKIALESLYEEVTLLLDQYLKEAKASFVVNFSEAGQVYSVRSYLHSIFYNLISNAIKFRDPRRPLSIRIVSWRENQQVCVSFSDNGLGVDLSRHKESLFGLYKRFHLQVEGKGMGLHLVKTQLEALNGSISVESQEGAGTTFTIRLPM